MKHIITFTIICFVLNPLLAQKQVFDIGVLSSAGSTAKLPGEFIISDSIVTIGFSTGKTIKQVKEVMPDHQTIYVTDGTAVDRISISTYSGKISGYKFDCVITYHPDSRFTSDPVIKYFCRRRD